MLRVSLVGLGQIGGLILKNLYRRGYDIIAVVDIDDNKVGKDAGSLAFGEEIGVKVSSKIQDVQGSDVVLHSTTSFFDKAYPQLEKIVKLGSNVISTCETLSYPWARYPVLANRIDKLARIHGVTIVGAGINPGFVLDTLPSILASTVPNLRKIQAVRRLEPTKRRPAFQKKVGIGLSEKVYREKLEKGELTGHVGYLESAYLIMQVLGRQPSDVREWQEPVTADQTIELPDGSKLEAGQVKGVIGGAKAIANNLVVEVVFKAYIGAGEGETIRIEGDEGGVEWSSTGTQGDMGTASIVASLAERIYVEEPGLLTMADLVPFRPF